MDSPEHLEHKAHLERWVRAVLQGYRDHLDQLVQQGILVLKDHEVLVDPLEFREFLDRRVHLVHQERQVRLDRLVHLVRNSPAPLAMHRKIWS